MPLNNFGVVGPAIWRSAQPSAEDVPVLYALGITTVLKLNTREEALVVELAPGIVVWEYALGLHAPDDAVTRQIIDQLHGDVERGARVLIHCTHGRDRTGFICAAYQVMVLGLSLPRALAERARFGVDTPWHELANLSFTHALGRLAQRR